jgi:regulator of sigma D
MDGIAKVAMNFLKKYEAIGVDKELAGAFAKDFATIGQVLGARIQKEEQVLYPLYMPQY